jgi:hypothetical protein
LARKNTAPILEALRRKRLVKIESRARNKRSDDDSAIFHPRGYVPGGAISLLSSNNFTESKVTFEVAAAPSNDSTSQTCGASKLSTRRFEQVNLDWRTYF